MFKEQDIHKIVREGYGKIARNNTSCCGTNKSKTSCGCNCNTSVETISKNIGYNEADLTSVPEDANLGLGCGNPVALASLKPGEVVLDLGSGAGFDCFLAASRVGPQGKVIGVDMTADMLDKARDNAAKGNYKNVEFRLGEIENLPVADNTIDAIISNCVINLSPNKPRVFSEAFRVLKTGGQLMVSDIVLNQALPEKIRNSVSAYIGCLSGAILKDDYLNTIKKAGFKKIKILEESSFPVNEMVNDPDSEQKPEKALNLSNSICSIRVSAIK
jgi:arsenite methyltransferase